MPALLKTSFRDPSGFVYKSGESFYRQINKSYKEQYQKLKETNLLEELWRKQLLIEHKEVSGKGSIDANHYLTIEPRTIPFVSYPYEWCFSEYKKAALLTLEIEEIALKKGMTLKDASAFNVQFIGSNPVFIDTLSFEIYREGDPWVAYKQFCEHFLAPLSLMAYQDVRLNALFQSSVNGIPLDIASKLLPFKTKFNLQLFLHIHLHAKKQKQFADSTKLIEEDQSKERSARSKLTENKKLRISKHSRLALIDGLKSAVLRLKWNPGGTEWADYYNNTNYSSTAFTEKHKIIDSMLKAVAPKVVWDFGANDGEFSMIAEKHGAYVVSFDVDPSAVEKNFIRLSNNKQNKAKNNILPLMSDLTSPTPAIGWGHAERMSLVERGPADLLLSLALIHHLAISNNTPLALIAEYFSKCSRNLIIEFVPKTDSQVQKLLATRKDIFPEYTQEFFEKEFSNFFKIISAEKISGSERVLYLLKAL
ncbi:MAG: SAM-dependent methyltransferase [Proteobacteria bacterium]|nr:SAM-dependent methyltransferase [Pseudomonadota bacterium]